MHKAVMDNKPFEEIPLEECRTTIDNYKATFPGIVSYAYEQIDFARKNGYVETLFGHRRPIPDINHPWPSARKKAENQCMNTPIQGTGADIMRYAMLNIAKEIRRRASLNPQWEEVKLIMQVHDDQLAETPEELALEVAKLFKTEMEKSFNDFLALIGRGHIHFDVPITCDPAIGRVWANVLDVSFDGDGGRVYVKEEKKERLDVTLEDLTEEDLTAYRKAGIEVWMKCKDDTKKRVA